MEEKILAENNSELAGAEDTEEMTKDKNEEMTEDMTEDKTAEQTEENTDTEDSPDGADNTESDKEFEKESTRQAFTRRLNEAKAEIEAKYKGYDNLVATLKELGVDGSSPEELIYALKAEAEGITAEEVKQREEAKNKALQEALENHPDIVAAREAKQKAEALIAESIFKADLEEIKKAYPDVKAKDVFELGDVYINLMKQENMSPVAAYAAQLAVNNAGKKEKPASMGGIKANSGQAEKDFISSEEYDKMVAENPKLLDSDKFRQLVRRSMMKW